MYLDLTVFKRCCCCLPLRHGLMTWGIFKVFVSGFLASVSMRLDLERAVRYERTVEIVFISAALMTAVIDVILNVILVMGCVQKNVSLLRKYYCYCKFMVTLISVWTILNLIGLGVCIYNLTSISCYLFTFWKEVTNFAAIALHVYVMLLVRSEILKLNDSWLINANNAVDTEANLDAKTNGDKYTED